MEVGVRTVGDEQFVALDEVALPAAVPTPLNLSEDIETTPKSVDNAQAASGLCGVLPCSAAAPARSSPPSKLGSDLRGQPTSYVPPGALSVSVARRVNGKYYPAGSLEYLHGQYHIPFPLPDVPKQGLTLPPPVAPGICPLTGKPLWHAGLGVNTSNGPQTFMLDGRQFVVVGAGDTLFAFALHP